MSIKNGKRIIKEVDGRNVVVVEQNVSNERANFLKQLLEHNKYEVLVIADLESETKNTFTICVSDLHFNVTLKIYERSLKNIDNEAVTVSYWNQTDEKDNLPYFEHREKNPDAIGMDDFLANPWAYRTIG